VRSKKNLGDPPIWQKILTTRNIFAAYPHLAISMMEAILLWAKRQVKRGLKGGELTVTWAVRVEGGELGGDLSDDAVKRARIYRRDNR